MSKCDIRPQNECQNRISNVKIRYSASERMSHYDFECQNTIFGLTVNAKIDFRISKYRIFGLSANVKIGF